MLIPGLPAPGVQQDAFKPERKIRADAIEGVPGEPLSELPVEDYVSQQEGESHHQEEPATQPVEEATAPVEAAPSGSPDLPRKGLLVDIRV